MNRYEPSWFKQTFHTCYLCEINSAPSEEKLFARAQNYFSEKALLVYAVFAWNNNILKQVVV